MRLPSRLVAVILLAATSMAARAWIYPEHRELAMLAVEGLDAGRRAAFDGLWREARAGDEARLCEAGADESQALTPACIDWAALSAIAGDHSCSSRQMLDIATRSDWVLQVADVSAQLKLDLSRIPVTASIDTSAATKDMIADAQRRLADQNARAARINALRTADLRLQRADPEYATRAGSNNAHFLLPRPHNDTTLIEYAELTLRPGSELSAIGTYAWFHLGALQKASRLSRETLAPAERAALARAMLADEAFALHFLEDVFAAGHISGTWGNTAQRQGTHDYYNENGLEVFTWAGGARSLVLMGDARMRPQDAEIAAASVRKSLQELLDVAASDTYEGQAFPYTPAAPAAPEDFDVCRNDKLPKRPPGTTVQPEHRPFFAAILVETPVPGLGPGVGSMPRFRSEVGLFIGLAGTIDARRVNGGFVPGQDADGWISGLDLAFRIGVGLDGVMNDGGDGLAYASLGLRTDSPSTNKILDDSHGPLSSGNLTAAIPARAGISTRLRMPFYLVPADLVLLAPLYFFDSQAYTKMAVTATNGGLIPWQSGWATSIGRFQFVLGRELGVTFYGGRGHDQLIAPPAVAGGEARVANYESIAYDIPIAEYRPYRAFAQNQSSSVIFQLFADIDVPRKSVIVFPEGAPGVSLRSVKSIGVRMVFDWRHYR
jgi:hypothetical protein